MPLFDLSCDRCYNCGRPIDPANGQQFCSQVCETVYIEDRGTDDDAALDALDHIVEDLTFGEEDEEIDL